MEENPFQKEINQIKGSLKDAEESLKELPDVKEGKSTVEEEKQEPGFILYKQISESMIKLMESPEVASEFVKIGQKLGEDMSRAMVNLIAMCTVTASHNAILFYDDLLKEELKSNFNLVTTHLNGHFADIGAMKAVLEVFRKRLDDIEKTLKIEELKNDT